MTAPESHQPRSTWTSPKSPSFYPLRCQSTREKLDDECDHDERKQYGNGDRGDGSHRGDDSEGSTVTGIRFLTRQGCPLCNEALAVVRPIAAAAGYEIEIIDIDLDLALLERYNDRVPVLEAAPGDVIDEGRIDPEIVARHLREHV